MRFIELITTVSPEEVCRDHDEVYAHNDSLKMSPVWYREVFLPLVLSKVLVNSPGCKLVLNHWVTKHDDPCDDTDSVDVGMEDAKGDYYSISFSPWNEILNFEVVDYTDLNLTPSQRAAHLI